MYEGGAQTRQASPDPSELARFCLSMEFEVEEAVDFPFMVIRSSYVHLFLVKQAQAFIDEAKKCLFSVTHVLNGNPSYNVPSIQDVRTLSSTLLHSLAPSQTKSLILINLFRAHCEDAIYLASPPPLDRNKVYLRGVDRCSLLFGSDRHYIAEGVFQIDPKFFRTCRRRFRVSLLYSRITIDLILTAPSLCLTRSTLTSTFRIAATVSTMMVVGSLTSSVCIVLLEYNFLARKLSS